MSLLCLGLDVIKAVNHREGGHLVPISGFINYEVTPKLSDGRGESFEIRYSRVLAPIFA